MTKNTYIKLKIKSPYYVSAIRYPEDCLAHRIMAFYINRLYLYDELNGRMYLKLY